MTDPSIQEREAAEWLELVLSRHMPQCGCRKVFIAKQDDGVLLEPGELR